MPSRVALIVCKSYEADEVSAAVQRGMSCLGGVGVFVKPGDKILLKPNILAASAPKKAVTTHPAVFRAVAQMLTEAGAELSFGDSPGIGNPKRTAASCGILALAEEMGIPLADFVNPVQVSFPKGLFLKQMQLAAGVLAADGLVSLPKMKTHALTRITGAVKNQFGCVPGFLKGEFHVKMSDIEQFCQMLVDVNLYLRPRLFIMDGIVAMSGNGPRGGEPFPMNVLLFSSDPLALDAVFCRLIDLDPRWVPTMEIGRQAGLGTYLADEIELLGDEIGPLVRRDFTVKRRPYESSVALPYVPQALKHWLSPRPLINGQLCRGCGDCITMCPVLPKALKTPNEQKKAVPVYDYGLCIRCYCCQEICPAKAITLTVPPLRRLLQILIRF